jgi:UDP-glucose:(heptosyl)LPS alpha-1,3-glucosyltransferase
MKVGLAIFSCDPKKGGAERYAYDLSCTLKARGHEVILFCGRGAEIEGVKCIELNSLSFPRWLRNLAFALMHRKALMGVPVDVMVGFGNCLDLDVYQSHGGVQRVWMRREIASYDNPRERAFRAFLLKNSVNQKVQRWIEEYPIRSKRYVRIVAISDMVRHHMAEHYKLNQAEFDTVYNGVDTERFRPAPPRSDGKLRVLFSAGNFRLKGLSPLLRAFARVIRRSKVFHLYVLGRGRRERYVKSLDELNITDHVTFIGETASPETAYREAHILAHPTYYDACSLTTMESMATGLPTVTTRWNGASALISPGEGYVIEEPEDIPALVSAMEALRDKDLRYEMGKRARMKLEAYTIEKNTTQMEAIFQEVCDGKHPY